MVWLVSRNNIIVSDRVQRTSEGYMSSDGTTARRADDQQSIQSTKSNSEQPLSTKSEVLNVSKVGD